MWEFRTKKFLVSWKIEKTKPDLRDMEPEYALECKRRVASGEWTCFDSRVLVIYLPTMEELGTGYLGQSIYANPSEFRDHFGCAGKGHGSYFLDMVRESVRLARMNYPVLRAGLIHNRERAEALLARVPEGLVKGPRA